MYRRFRFFVFKIVFFQPSPENLPEVLFVILLPGWSPACPCGIGLEDSDIFLHFVAAFLARRVALVEIGEKVAFFVHKVTHEDVGDGESLRH